jgi:hypothetical protein
MATAADMSEPDIAAVMTDAMNAENRRRGAAASAPGLGVLMSLPQSPNAAAVGKSSLDMPAVGEGLAPIPYAAQYTAPGPEVPAYADALVGGQGYAPGDVQRYLSEVGEQVFAAQDARAAAGPGIEVISPQAEAAPRRSLWSRLTGRRRRR